MIVLTNFVNVIGKYIVFSGRASRSEFWWYFLVMSIANCFFIVAGQVKDLQAVTLYPTSYLAFHALTVCPTMAVTIRRLHDVGFSAWRMLGYAPLILSTIWAVMSDSHLAIAGAAYLIGLICYVTMIVHATLRGASGDNKYGPAPKPTARD